MQRTLVALTLAAALAAGWPTFLDQIWTLLSSVWSESSPDAGCGMDPDGRCTPAPDAGCGFDPDGCPQGS